MIKPSVAFPRPLVLLALLFLAPLAVSFWLYYGADWRPSSSTNNGELIQPLRLLPGRVLPLATGGNTTIGWLRGKWSLIVIADGACNAVCRQTLIYARQTYLGMGRDASRLQRVWLTTARCCDRSFLQREHPGLVAVDAGNGEGRGLLEAFPAPDRDWMIFIVDPLGNLMMRYDSRRDPKGLRSDLSKLLSLSHIG